MNRTIGKVGPISIAGILLLAALVMSGLTAFAYQPQDGASGANAMLKHAPAGSANLQWDPQSKALTVTLSLTGLQANSRHPAHIHAGDCSIDGTILYPLNDVVADAAGNATTTTVIPNVTGGIPATGWYINVHSGPTLATPAEMVPVTCGNVTNPNAAQSLTVTLDGTSGPNQMAAGTATLSLEGDTLTVKTTMSNLVPGSSHAAHIHAGSCEKQLPGNILYHLMPLTADSSGNATSVTTIKGVTTIPITGWYINIHFSTDLSTQAGYDVIACGNVVN